MTLKPIDFNKYKPSSKGGPSLATPSASMAPVATQSAAPRVPLATPAPMTPKPVTQTTQYNPSRGTFFSGGARSKVLDVLSAPSYALSGFLSGAKSATRNINKEMGLGEDTTAINLSAKRKELNKPLTTSEAVRRMKEGLVGGIKNIAPAIAFKQGFGTGEGDFNFGAELSNDRTGQVAANFLTDVTTPGLPVGKAVKPAMSAAKYLPFADEAVKLAGKADKLAKETPFVYKAIEKINPYFRNPEFGKVITASERQSTSRITELYDTVKALSKDLTPEQQRQVTAVIEKRIAAPNPRIAEIAQRVASLGDDIGAEAVATGLLKQETLDKFKGQYVSHIFDTAKKNNGFTSRFQDVSKVVGNQFKKREGKAGFIEEFAPATFKGLGNEIKDVEAVKFYRDIANKFGKRVTGKTLPEGYVLASEAGIEGRRFGKSFGRIALPKEIAEYLVRSTEVTKRGIPEKLVDLWKAGKTIWNPAYHSRNLASNQILSELSTGEGLPMTIAKYVRSIKGYSGKDDYYKAAKQAGLIGQQSLGSGFNEMLSGAGLRGGKGQRALRSVAKAPEKLQNFTEDTAKLNVFRTWLDRYAKQAGITAKEALSDQGLVKKAVDKAEEAIFSPYKISKQERSVMGKLFPFYSFTRQSIPFLGKTLAKQPGRILKYEKAKKGIEELSAPEAGQGEIPPEFKKQIRLPGKDERGRYRYFDPSYILPWGNLLPEESNTGGVPLGINPNPPLMAALMAGINYDPYFKKPIRKEGDPASLQTKSTLDYLRKQIAPTLPNNIMDKVMPALAGRPDYRGGERSVPESLLYTLGGLRTTLADPEKLRTQQKLNQVYKLRSQKDRKAAVLKDQSLSPEEKRQILEQF